MDVIEINTNRIPLVKKLLFGKTLILDDSNNSIEFDKFYIKELSLEDETNKYFLETEFKELPSGLTEKLSEEVKKVEVIKIELTYSKIEELTVLLPGCFVIYGTKINNIYTEEYLSPLLESNTYNLIKEKFCLTFESNVVESLLPCLMQDLPQICYTELLTDKPLNKVKQEVRNLDGNYFFVFQINNLHSSFVKSVLNNNNNEYEYYFPNGNKEVILISYLSDNEDKCSVEYSNESEIVVNVKISKDTYQGISDFVELIPKLNELLINNSFPKYVIPKIIIPPPTGGGCCGKGTCDSCPGVNKEYEPGECEPGECEPGKCESGKCESGKCVNKECVCGGANCKNTEPCGNSNCCKKKVECKGSCSAPPPETNSELEKLVSEFKLPEISDCEYVLYMKGTKEEPKCKYSRQMVELLKVHSLEYRSVNLLLPENQILRSYLKKTFPTFPQLWYKNQFLTNLDKLLESPELIKIN